MIPFDYVSRSVSFIARCFSKSSMSTSSNASVTSSNSGDSEAEYDHLERRNVCSLVFHQVLFRTAWIFKTESVIMPAFLDSITESGWVRGMLPPLNRFGQSIAPLLLSDRLSRSEMKSRWLATSTFLMSLPFLLIGGLVLLVQTPTPPWFVFAFLASYGTFFCVHGVNQSAFNTLQGKVIRPNRRGRLIMIAGYIGSPVAVLMAWLLLKPWTETQPPEFAYIFLFTGGTFLLASLTLRWIIETPDSKQSQTTIVFRRRFAEAAYLLQADPQLRRLCLLATLFVTSQLLFPHYQRLGRESKDYSGQMLMIWVVAQNLSAAVFSWLSGAIADRRGTRSALRTLTFLAIFTPLLALLLGNFGSANWYWLTFAWLGVVPVTFRMQLNYALELTDRINHPIYVSTVVLSMAAPIVFSPLVGELVDRTGYVISFCGISCIVLAAWLTSLSMVEPRHPDFRPARVDVATRRQIT